MGFSSGSSSISGSSDVALNGPTDDDVLTYNAAAQKWTNGTLSRTVINVKNAPYNAAGDSMQVGDAVMNAGSATLTSSTAFFTVARVGQAIRVAGAGSAGADLVTTIQSRQSASSVTLAASASTSVSAAVTMWGIDDSAAISAAIADAASAYATVGFPSGTYMVDSLVMAGAYVKLMGMGGPMSRFGRQSRADGAVILRHLPGSSNIMLSLNATGLSLENVTLDGNNAPGTVLQITHGFETRLDTVRVAYGAGLGIDIMGSDNTSYKDVFVDNCGSSSLPAVRLKSVYPHTINTIDFNGLTIERCVGTHLDVNTALDTAHNDYPEFVRISNLHIESPTDNGGVPNSGPLVRLGNFRSLTLVNPFIYGGPGPLISHELTSSLGALGGVVILGGTLLGQSQTSGYQPASLVRLMTGDQFAMVGTRLDSYSGNAVVVDATYGPNVYIDPTTMAAPNLGDILADNRSTLSPFFFNTPTRILGPSNGVPNSQAAPRGVHIGQNSSGSTALSLATGAKNWQVLANETTNQLNFNLAGTLNLGYFDVAGNFGITGGFKHGFSAKSSSYTLNNDSTILVTAGAVLTLPTAVGVAGRQYILKNGDTSVPSTILTTSGQTIDGATSPALNAGQAWTVQSNGANWILISDGRVTNSSTNTVSVDGLVAPLVPANYYAPYAITTSSYTLSAGLLKSGLIIAGRSCTLNEIGIEIITAGSAGAVLRLGIYKILAGTSNSASLLVDAGTISATATGYVSLGITQPVTVGDKLLVVAACQGAPATGPVIRSSVGAQSYFGSTSPLIISQNPLAGSQASGITGALPSTHTLSGSADAARILIRSNA